METKEGYQEGWDDAFKIVSEVGEKLAKGNGKYLQDRLKELELEEK